MEPATLELVLDNLERIKFAAEGMGAESCCQPKAACPKCEILFLAKEALAALGTK